MTKPRLQPNAALSTSKSDLTLNKLPKQSRQAAKRLGRGIGSKHGKTAGRGHKGQRARSGHKIGFAFEGGQTPFYRRVPKRGFKNINRIVYFPLALTKLETFKGSEITPALLHQARLITRLTTKYKILGSAKLTHPVILHAHKISQTARAALEAAGGKFKPLP